MTTTMTAATTPAPAYGPATAFAVAENASPDAAGQADPYATHPNPKETIPMTDQTIPADEVRKIIAFYRDGASDRGGMILDALTGLLPPPPPPTLADMTPEEREACQWMQCDVTGFQGQWVLATLCDDDDEAGLIADCGEICWSSPAQVTPRPDLPRLEWPGDQKPAPDKTRAARQSLEEA